MSGINELADEVRAVNAANGWNPIIVEDWYNEKYKVPALIALIHSEIVEAHDEFMQDCTEYLALEFADIKIRILDLMGGLTNNFDWFVQRALKTGITLPADRQHAFNTLHKITTAALEAYRKNDRDAFANYMAVLYSTVGCFATHKFQIDTAYAVSAKIDINKHRAHRHGGKLV